jgi:hypothetical protein
MHFNFSHTKIKLNNNFGKIFGNNRLRILYTVFGSYLSDSESGLWVVRDFRLWLGFRMLAVGLKRPENIGLTADQTQGV